MKGLKCLGILLLTAAVITAGSVPVDAGYATLYTGSQGSDVRVLQRALRDRGYYTDSIDGKFGRNTCNAVMSFQRDRGLKVDGVVGRATWKALGYEGGGGGYTQSGSGSSGYNMNLLAQLVMAEAEGESYLGKVAVAAVVLNRVDSRDFPNSLEGVIYQPLAFEPVANGRIYNTPNADSVRAAEAAVSGWDPTEGCLYFWNPETAVSQWIWSREIVTQIGKHVFAR